MNTPNELLKHHVTGAIERGEKEAITSVVALKCDMEKDCSNRVMYIDSRGFIYCKPHGLRRKQSEPCRAMTPKEIKTLSSGSPISYRKVRAS